MRTFTKEAFDYSQLVDMVVDIKPVDVRSVKASGRRRSSIISKPPESFCIQCITNVTFLPHIHCLECKRTTVILCLSCFQLGAEIGEHVRGHNYEIAQRGGPAVFREVSDEGPSWGAFEDERLLSLIRTYKLDDWPKIALMEFGRVRTVEEALNHFSRCFMNSIISEIAIENIKRSPIHVFGFSEPEFYTGEFFKPTTSEDLRLQIKEIYESLPNWAQILFEIDYAEPSAISPMKMSSVVMSEQLENMICEFSHIHVEHNPAVLAELLYGRPRCFIHHRFTHLHKLPKRGQDLSFTEDNKPPHYDQLNQTPRSRKCSLPQAPILEKMEDEQNSNDAINAQKILDDRNVEIEDSTPELGSPLLLNSNNLDDSPSLMFAFPNGTSSPPKSPLREIVFSCSPSPPDLSNHANEINVTSELNGKSSNSSENEDNSAEYANHGYDVRERNIQRRRDTFSYSPPKVRSRSSGRGRRKRKLGADRPLKSGAVNGVVQNMSEVKIQNPRSHKRPSNSRVQSGYLSMEEALAYRLVYPTLKFLNEDPPLLSKQRVRRFDAEDLNLIAYNPKRDDFEHEYRNGGEQFISKIFLNGECLISSEIEQFKNAIRIAKVQRYNRILERRYSNHAVIREHQLLNEFFSIVKTNVNERGKYTLFAGESFPSRKRAEECRPFFAKFRRVLGSKEVLDLAEDVAEIETLMTRIRMLRSLQLAGTTELKGRFKSEVPFTPRGRKRRTRKADGELRKAGLRWERIKRWNKRNLNPNYFVDFMDT
ncbi:hypothetical protein M3Y95_00072700 [Aphelenchoides besseyi]|nr:hypothetical protein M3Y95_00072700 [Aphelenchoides besseyi]